MERELRGLRRSRQAPRLVECDERSIWMIPPTRRACPPGFPSDVLGAVGPRLVPGGSGVEMVAQRGREAPRRLCNPGSPKEPALLERAGQVRGLLPGRGIRVKGLGQKRDGAPGVPDADDRRVGRIRGSSRNAQLQVDHVGALRTAPGSVTAEQRQVRLQSS